MGDDRVLGVERGEGGMPHVVIENAPDLAVVFRGLAPFAERTDEQILRLADLYLNRAGLVLASRFCKTNLQDYLP